VSLEIKKSNSYIYTHKGVVGIERKDFFSLKNNIKNNNMAREG